MRRVRPRSAVARGPTSNHSPNRINQSAHGTELIEQHARSTQIQKQRWIEIYRHLWERKAKVDIADVIIIENGILQAWFYTSAKTGEIQRKMENKLNTITIKRHFVKATDTTAISRDIAWLFHEDSDGDIAATLLTDVDFNLVLCRSASPIWMTSFLLQPFLSSSRRHARYSSTFVGKYNASVTSSVRVLAIGTCFHQIKGEMIPKPSSSTCTSISKKHSNMPREVEELVHMETARIVHEIEVAMGCGLKEINLEFQISRTHRLILTRASRIVYFSDLKQHQASKSLLMRPVSTGRQPMKQKCAGGQFCHLNTSEVRMARNVAFNSREMQKIARKSLHDCNEESDFLESIGADAEAHLISASAAPLIGVNEGVTYDTIKRSLERRFFMLKSTLWNPDSVSFSAKPLAWDDEKRNHSQQYEMVDVCRTCYLIYHTMDVARFQSTKRTVKAAVRRLTMIYNAKLSVRDISISRHPSIVKCNESALSDNTLEDLIVIEDEQ